MATQKKERDWAALEDEDEERLEPHAVETKIIRPKEKANEKPTQEEVVIQKKWLIPVRKQVKDRKNWEKFGEVVGIPKGKHKPGDFAIDNIVDIQTSGEQGEIGIVKQLTKMTAESVKETRERKKLDEIEAQATKKDTGKTEDKGENKWTKAFGNKGQSFEFSIKISNIVTVEKEWKDNENQLNEFFDDLFRPLNIKSKKRKYVTDKDRKRFLGRAYFVFEKQEDAEKALEALRGATFNNAALEADVSEPPSSNAPPRKR